MLSFRHRIAQSFKLKKMMSELQNQLEPIAITQKTGGCTLDGPPEEASSVIEDIMNPTNLLHENQKLYPPLPIFKDTYKLWLKHQSCFWSVHENDPSVDRDKFVAKCDPGFKKILLKSIGCIAIGDSVVLNTLDEDALNEITSIELKAMLTDQEAREFIHKNMYNRMLDVSPDANYYRSEEFRDEYMGRFEKLAQKYNSRFIQIKMFLIMMCEYILFAPMFQTICYAATKGICPKLCDLNLLVMRDENIHYENARLQLSKFKVKIDHKLARQITKEFFNKTLEIYKQIIGDYDDGTYNFEHVEKHCRHVLHGFMAENRLYDSEEEFKEAQHLYAITPAAFYMNLPKCESKVNRMESNSTIYAVPGDVSQLVKPKRRRIGSDSDSDEEEGNQQKKLRISNEESDVDSNCGSDYNINNSWGTSPFSSDNEPLIEDEAIECETCEENNSSGGEENDS